MSGLPKPETMLAYASILEKRQYVVKNGVRFPIATGEIIEAACAALRYCAAAQAPGVRAEDYARAIYDASRDRAGLHPISNERWGEFYDSGLQEALALRAQAEACAALSDTSELGK